MSQHTRRTFLTTTGTVLGGIAVGSTVTAATRTERFIVRTRERRTPSAVEVVHEMPGVDVAVVRGSESAVAESAAVEAYAPDVEVDVDLPAPSDAAPTVEETSVGDEPGYGLQWDKQDLDVADAHRVTEGEGSRVTVIDTGVAAGHPDLTVNEELSRNFTGDGFGAATPAGGYHGTHVAGIVGASDDGGGVIGTAPATELVDCRVFSPASSASFGDILAAVVYSAAIGADAANLSLGAYPVPRRGFGSFYGKVLNSVMTYANSRGTLLVAAAGNDGADLQHDGNVVSLPNEGAQGFSVAATGPIGFGWDAADESPPQSPAFYTNYGTNAVDLAAPGGDAHLGAIGSGVPYYLDLVFNTIAEPIYETDEDGDVTGIDDVEYTYSWLAGTSMAAPQVAGAVALLRSEYPDLNANQVASRLRRVAEVPDGYDKSYYGAGYLNVVDAL
ncbi:S8 family peptidase [Haloarcula litorea]|uniref:S8 family peptidase n=1 Tax=Haloarcula litorea TaxID=3032579 RepID=UPI0023E8BA72|nr:S8 family serine peptidase [Halomicroarcula sp. GDY20]